MKNKIMWKDVTLIVLAILLIFSMCRIHTLKQSNKKLYSQNLELNHQLATLKEKNAGLESKLNSEESITDESVETVIVTTSIEYINVRCEEK